MLQAIAIRYREGIMADTNINIIFRNGTEPGNESNPEAPGSTPNPEDPTQQNETSGQGVSFSTGTLALYTAKQALNMATSRVGEMMGSSVLQDKVNASLKVVSYGCAIAVNPALGIMNIVMDLTNSSIDYSIKASQEQSALQVLNTRAGNINRSR